MHKIWAYRSFMWVYTHNRILLSVKMKEFLTHATTWLNLQDIILSEISSHEKTQYCMVPLIWDRVKFTQRENRIVVTRGWGRKEWSYCLMDAVCFARWKKFWGWKHNHVNVQWPLNNVVLNVFPLYDFLIHFFLQLTFLLRIQYIGAPG